MSKSITIQDHTFPSKKAAAEHFGVSEATLRSRLRRGLTIEKALGLVEHERKARTGNEIDIEGTLFSSVTEAANHYNINPRTVMSRMENGQSAEAALGIKPNKENTFRPHIKVELEGVAYDNLKLACEKYGLAYHTVNMRISRGWPIERAFGLTQ